MSKLKATPGLWKVFDQDAYDDNRLWVNSVEAEAAGRGEIASLAVGFNEPHETEQWANANLISAGPDLYAALDDVLPLAIAWVAHYQGAQGLDDLHPMHEEIIEKSWLALRKARGES